MNEPKLRFPEFTGEWEEKKVKEIFEITRGQVLPAAKTKPEVDGLYKYPVYSSQTMRNGLMGYYNEALFNNAITWTTDGANAGTVRYRKGDFYCTNVCGVLLSKDGYANECIAELLNIICKSHVSFVGNPKLMNNVMAEIVIPVPPLQEQQKIASCLSAMDDLIAAQAEKVEALKEKKTGLMQQLFPQPGETTPRLRFPEFTGEWEVKKLGEVASSFSGGTPKSSESKYYGGDIPFIRSGEIHGCKTELYITEEGLNKSSAKLVSKGDLLIALYGATSGEVAISKIDGAINQAILCVRSQSINSNYLCNYLEYKKDTITSKFLQGGQGNLSSDIIMSLNIPSPSPAEQEKIASCLSALDDQIAAETEKLTALKDYKKGLMQQLFPQPAK